MRRRYKLVGSAVLRLDCFRGRRRLLHFSLHIAPPVSALPTLPNGLLKQERRCRCPGRRLRRKAERFCPLLLRRVDRKHRGIDKTDRTLFKQPALMDGEVFFDAPAKVNLSLDIVGRRPDGYHLLETVMLSIPLFDRIGMTISNGTGISLDAPPELMKGNTLIKTARLFRCAQPVCPKGISRFCLTSKIPCRRGSRRRKRRCRRPAARLKRLCGYPLSPSELNALAVEVGADVPFCAIGGCAFCTGIGEVITPLPVPTGFIMIVC